MAELALRYRVHFGCMSTQAHLVPWLWVGVSDVVDRGIQKRGPMSIFGDLMETTLEGKQEARGVDALLGHLIKKILVRDKLSSTVQRLLKFLSQK